MMTLKWSLNTEQSSSDCPSASGLYFVEHWGDWAMSDEDPCEAVGSRILADKFVCLAITSI